MTDTPETPARKNLYGLLTCGHKSPAAYWPCAEPAGHYGSHQNAALGWPRRPDDDCPPPETLCH